MASVVPGRSRLRAGLDWLYAAAGALAAFFLLGVCVLMLVQVAGRELGTQVRGADDLTAWFCAASAFLALAHTFKRGELVRVGLVIQHLSPGALRAAEIFSLGCAVVMVGFMVYAATQFVFESWKMNELAQGLIPIPIWIPQLSFVVGVSVLFVALVDELVIVLRGGTPGYRLAEEERLARGDFSELT